MSPSPPANCSMRSAEPVNQSQIRKCHGSTKRGFPCGCRPVRGKNYCGRHLKLYKFPKPETCPICTESLDKVPQPLSCGHWVHRECVLKWKDQCPVCRALISLTKRERGQLAKNTQPTSPPETDDLTRQAIGRLLQENQMNAPNMGGNMWMPLLFMPNSGWLDMGEFADSEDASVIERLIVTRALDDLMRGLGANGPVIHPDLMQDLPEREFIDDSDGDIGSEPDSDVGSDLESDGE